MFFRACVRPLTSVTLACRKPRGVANRITGSKAKRSDPKSNEFVKEFVKDSKQDIYGFYMRTIKRAFMETTFYYRKTGLSWSS